jgi:hypothetical protein
MRYQAITELEVIERAFDKLKATFSSSATIFADRTVGFQGGAHHCDVFWSSEFKYWSVFEKNVVNDRYWICFGQENPTKAKSLTITVEINPPKKGINRRCAGLFVRDMEGKTYIAHSGRIGGGRKGVGKKGFRQFASNHLWTDVNWPDNKQSSYLIISEIGDDSAAENLGRFVSLAAAFKKSAVSGYITRSRESPRSNPLEPKQETRNTFSGLLTNILEQNSDGLTPQRIRDIIKSDFAEFYGTDSHKRNVERGHYKDLDHALLAQVYSTASTCRRIEADKSQKPVVLFYAAGKAALKGAVVKPSRVDATKRSRKPRKQVRFQHMATPKPSLIKKYLRNWRQLENYQLQESSLKILFHSLCPHNEETELVLLKVSALNDFYSTHIYDTYAVAKHIVELEVDQRLAINDLSLVNEIALVPIGESVKNFYSFASKFCSHHKPDEYPIYDSYVEIMLVNYKNKDSFDRFAKVDLKRYEHFVKIIKAFREFYGLNDFSLRDIDRFLWLAGKEWFPKKY